MFAPVQTQLPSVVARAAAADASLFKPGQVLEALVLGKAPDGMVALKIGEIVVNAQLPQTLPPGTTLQLQVKAGGLAPQLAIVGTPQLPAVVPAALMPVLPPTPLVVPMPQVVPVASPPAATVLTPQGAPVPAAAAAAQPTGQPQVAASPPVAQPAPSQVWQGQAVVAPQAAVVPRGVPTPVQAPNAPTPIPQPASAGTAAPIVESRQTVATPTAPAESRAMPTQVVVQAAPVAADAARPAASAAPQPPSVVAPQGAPVAQSTASQPQHPVAAQPVIGSANPAAPAAAPLAGSGGAVLAPSLGLVAPAPIAATPQVVSALAPVATPPLASPAAQAVTPPAMNPAPVASAPPSAPMAPSQAVAPQTAGQAAPVPASITTPQLPAQPVLQPAPLSVSASAAVVPAAERDAASPLLVAQGAPRPSPSAADLPRSIPLPSGAPQVQSHVARATPASALAQMVPEAMARQNSLAPLVASLATFVARPGAIPEPVLRAALQLLGQRVTVPPSGPTAQTIESALAKSGVYLEAGLAKGAPAADLKSALVALKGAAATWLGGNPAPVTAPNQPAPPLRGLPPRVEPAELPPLPDAPREAARAIHNQADAALSRVKLMQLASLPDADPVRAPMPELRVEVPFLVGQQLVMAQFQVLRDREQQRADGKRGWTMRFAMNFAEGGEVGAEIGLLGRSVNVALWAADPETAADLEAALPELAPALAAIGLEPGAVRVRTLPPDPAKPQSGHFVDSRR